MTSDPFRARAADRLATGSPLAFHADPDHLELLHQGWSDFRLIRHHGSLIPGSRTWFEMTVAAIVPVVLGFEHTLYDPPHRFAERLVHGPFSRFVHHHEFTAVTPARTRVTDRLDIGLPWYYGGEFALRFLLAGRVRQAFRQRGAALLRLAQAGILTGHPPAPVA